MKKSLIFVLFLTVVSVLSLTLVSAQTSSTTVTACPGAPPPRLTVGETAQVAQAFSSLRADVGSPVVLRVMYRANNDQFEVTDGPICAGPHYWWEVDFNGITGWVTEGVGATYWLEPAGTTTPSPTATVTSTAAPPTATPVGTLPPVAGCPGAPAPRLTVGGEGTVAQVYSTLRAGVGSNTALTIMYSANDPVFEVVSGPVCSGPYYWWEVTYDGITGWVTEGTGSTYWLEPLDSSSTSITRSSENDVEDEEMEATEEMEEVEEPETTPESEG